MEKLQEIMALIIRLVPAIFFDPVYLVLFGSLLFIIYNQYRRAYLMQQRIFRLRRSSPLQEMVSSLGYGLLGGLITSTLFIFLGFTLTGTGIIYIWLVALSLMLIHPRFLCFSYAGGLISLVNLIFGFPDINVPSILSLIAVLHLVESLLIFLNGHKNPMPIYIKDDAGQVVGGFSLQRFWPLPFISVLASVELSTTVGQTMAMPQWWPLLGANVAVPFGFMLVYRFFPIFAGLGYSDISLTSTPEKKAAYSARNLFFYSVGLMVLTMLAAKWRLPLLIPVLFAPLGHEWVIFYGQKREKMKTSVFSHSDGVMVLDVYPDSPAEKMGLKAGDVILQVNNREIASPEQLMSEMSPWLIDPTFVVKNMVEDTPRREVFYKGKVPPLGFIPAPLQNQAIYMVAKEGLLEHWWKKQQNKKKR